MCSGSMTTRVSEQGPGRTNGACVVPGVSVLVEIPRREPAALAYFETELFGTRNHRKANMADIWVGNSWDEVLVRRIGNAWPCALSILGAGNG